jgi:hypothetical protein
MVIKGMKMGVQTMKMLGFTGTFLGLVLCATLPAKASTYDVTFIGKVFDLVADINVGSTKNVLSVTGTVVGPNGSSISGLVPLGTQPAWIYDNKFNGAGNPYVSNPGILFSAGAWIYNLYSVGTGLSTVYYLSTYNPNGVSYNPGDLGKLTVSQTPLPAALPMFLTALGGLWFVMRRMNKKASDTGLEVEQLAAT